MKSFGPLGRKKDAVDWKLHRQGSISLCFYKLLLSVGHGKSKKLQSKDWWNPINPKFAIIYYMLFLSCQNPFLLKALGSRERSPRKPREKLRGGIMLEGSILKVPLNTTWKQPTLPDSLLVLIRSHWHLSPSGLGQGREFASRQGLAVSCPSPVFVLQTPSMCTESPYFAF